MYSRRVLILVGWCWSHIFLMATAVGDPSAPSLGATASDPKSMAAAFWKQLCDGNERAAQEIGRLIQPPLLSAFTFEGVGTAGAERGTLMVSVAGDTPSMVTDSWNSTKEVQLMLAAETWFYASVNKGGSDDFRACTLSKVGMGSPGFEPECSKTTHMDVAGKEPIRRFRVVNSMGVYVIVCPVSSSTVTQTSCFSRPTFLVSQFPSHLRGLRRHELLLTCRFRPLVWKILL